MCAEFLSSRLTFVDTEPDKLQIAMFSACDSHSVTITGNRLMHSVARLLCNN